jgi:hypothetical protein
MHSSSTKPTSKTTTNKGGQETPFLEDFEWRAGEAEAAPVIPLDFLASIAIGFDMSEVDFDRAAFNRLFPDRRIAEAIIDLQSRSEDLEWCFNDDTPPRVSRHFARGFARMQVVNLKRSFWKRTDVMGGHYGPFGCGRIFLCHRIRDIASLVFTPSETPWSPASGEDRAMFGAMANSFRGLEFHQAQHEGRWHIEICRGGRSLLQYLEPPFVPHPVVVQQGPTPPPPSSMIAEEAEWHLRAHDRSRQEDRFAWQDDERKKYNPGLGA